MDKLPPSLKDFIRNAAPAPRELPVPELKERYEERRRDEARRVNGSLPFNYPHGTVEFMVEMRIRDWVRRMDAEREEARRRQQQENAKPPSPPQPRKNITPPRN